ILPTLPLHIFAWFLYWMLAMYDDRSSSVRGTRKKLKEWNKCKKVVGYLVIDNSIDVVYDFIAKILSEITEPVIQVSSIVSVYILLMRQVRLAIVWSRQR